jgi:hypothetical protein
MSDPNLKVFYRKIGDGEYCVWFGTTLGESEIFTSRTKNGSDSKLFRGHCALRRSLFRACNRGWLLRIVPAQPFHLRVPIQLANGHRVLAPVLRDLDEQPEINPRA